MTEKQIVYQENVLDFQEVSFRVFKKENFFNYKGRATRMEYWGTQLVFMVLGFIMSSIVPLLGTTISGIISIIYLIFILYMFIPLICQGIRRMHDSGHSGWWILVPFVNLYFCFIDSTPGPNKYGPSEKYVEVKQIEATN